MKKKMLAIILVLSMILSGVASAEPDTGADLGELFSKRDRDAAYDAGEAILIQLTGSGASCDSDAVRIEGGTVTVTAKGTYILTGALNGMVIVDAGKDDKVQLVLDNAAITSATSAALYVRQADKVFVTLAEGAENTLVNGGAFSPIDENDIDAALFSKDDLTLNGTGSLTVLSPAGHGVVSKDDLAFTGGTYAVEAASHGLSGKDSVRIADGSFTITAGKDGIHSENDDDEKGFVAIAGGSFAIAAEGDGVSASGWLQIDGGSFAVTAGGGSANAEVHTGEWGMPGQGGQRGGGWGMPGQGGQRGGGPIGWGSQGDSGSASTGNGESCKGLKAGGSLILSGGSFQLDTADDAVHSGGGLTVNGGGYDIATGDDGFHSDETLTINDGAINISQSYEGLEGLVIVINGGDISLISSDDGLNAAGGNDQSGFGGRGDGFGMNSASSLTINGGTLVVNADGDGLDSNGALAVNGGMIYVSGPTSSFNGALDCGSSATITGGTVVAAGSSGMAASFGSGSTQGSIMVNVGNQAAGSAVTLTDAGGNVLLSWQPEKAYQNVVVSCAGLAQGGTYTLAAGSYSGTITLSSLSYGASGGWGGMGGMGGRR